MEVAVHRRGRLHHRALREGDSGHRHHHAHQGGRRGEGRVQPVPAGVPAAKAGEEVLRLHPLSHPHGVSPSRPEGGQHRGEPGVRGEIRVGDPQQHGSPVAAEEGRRHQGGVRRVLSAALCRPQPAAERHHRVRRGRCDLQGYAVYPVQGHRAVLHRGLRERFAALLRRCDDHGQVRRSGAGVLQLRPGRGGLA